MCTYTDISTHSHSPEQVSRGTRVMFHTQNLRGLKSHFHSLVRLCVTQTHSEMKLPAFRRLCSQAGGQWKDREKLTEDGLDWRGQVHCVSSLPISYPSGAKHWREQCTSCLSRPLKDSFPFTEEQIRDGNLTWSCTFLYVQLFIKAVEP